MCITQFRTSTSIPYTNMWDTKYRFLDSPSTFRASHSPPLSSPGYLVPRPPPHPPQAELPFVGRLWKLSTWHYPHTMDGASLHANERQLAFFERPFLDTKVAKSLV
uniref:Uncharacterized protein n=1 Tax=Eutreptiella gymnastica TaxID=73025 RepID=A0A7S1JBQ0_9EUGL